MPWSVDKVFTRGTSTMNPTKYLTVDTADQDLIGFGGSTNEEQGRGLLFGSTFYRPIIAVNYARRIGVIWLFVFSLVVRHCGVTVTSFIVFPDLVSILVSMRFHWWMMNWDRSKMDLGFRVAFTVMLALAVVKQHAGIHYLWSPYVP